MMLLRMTAGVLSQNISILNLMYYRTGLCLGLIFHNDVIFSGWDALSISRCPFLSIYFMDSIAVLVVYVAADPS